MTSPLQKRVVQRATLMFFLSAMSAATQPLNVIAGEISADFSASPEHQPGIVESTISTPVVNITTPNASGLSHNKFGAFDVGPEALILNNSDVGPSASQIGGQLEANPNLIGGKPADVILNEVTGTNPTLLEGYVEVHGTPADVIIANPNGLTCDGCGFLNTPRVTLSTGTPEFDRDLSLKSLVVRGGDIKIGEKGTNLGSVSVFNIVSRKISLEGSVMGNGDVNLVAGANRYHYRTGKAEALPSDGNEPEVAIDSTALGGMYAGRISIISNDKGSGVNMQGNMVANAGALSLSADGKLGFAAAQSKEGISARSKSASVRVERAARTQGAIVLEGLTSVQLAEKALLYAQGNADLSAISVTIGKGAIAAAGSDGDGHLSKKGNLAISAATVHARDTTLFAGQLLSITAGEIDIASGTQAEPVALHSLGNIVIVANTIHAAKSHSKADGNMALASGGKLKLDQGIYQAGGLLTVEASSLSNYASLYGKTAVAIRTTRGNLRNNGTIVSNAVSHLSSAAGIENPGKIESFRNVEFEAATQVNNQGVIAANRSVTLSADRFVNKGLIGSSNGFLNLQTESGFINSGGIQAHGGLYLQSGVTFDNVGNISSGQTAKIVVTDGDFRNSGTVKSGAIALRSKTLKNTRHIEAEETELVADVAEHISNTGTITAPDLFLRLGGRLDNKGRLLGWGRTEIGGRDGGSADSLVNHADAFINGADELHVISRSIDNKGSIGSSHGHLVIESRSDVNNRGLLYSGGDSHYFIDKSLTNSRGDIRAAKKLTIMGLSGPRIADLKNESGTIEAASGDLQIDAERITNKRNQVSVKQVTSTYTESGKSGRTTAMTVGQETVLAAGLPATIRAGGNLMLSANSVKNSYSQIAAGGKVSIRTELLLNEGRDLLRTADVTTVIPRSEHYCKTSILGTCAVMAERVWYETLQEKRVSVVGSIYGTIHAGTELLVHATRYFQNNALRPNLAGPNQATAMDATSKIAVTSPLVLSRMADPGMLERSVESLPLRQAVFEIAAPEAPFLMQTRTAFIDPEQLLGSDHFLDRFSTDRARPSIKRYGDAYAEYQILRDQAFELTGEMWPSLPAEHNKLVKEGYRNALAVLTSMGLTVGEPLTEQQIGALTNDIIWLEKKDVLGEEVLVPRLYFAPARFDKSDTRSARLKAAGELSVDAALLHNSGTIGSQSNLKLHADSDLVNQGGSIVAGGAVSLKAERTVANLSGLVSGSRVAMDADYVTNNTLKTRENYGNGYVDQLQGKAEIKAEGSMIVTARKSISSEGGAFTIRDNAYIHSDQTITMSALPLARQREDGILDGHDRSSTVIHHPVRIMAGGSARLIAGGGITLRGAKVEGEGVVGLFAEDDVEIFSSQNSNSREVRIEAEAGMLGTKTIIHKQQAITRRLGTSIRAGELLIIDSGSGSVKLEAARIDSKGEAEVNARRGSVALVSSEEVTALKSSRREEDLLWMDQRDQVSGETMVRHVDIGSAGGLKIRAGEGISADYTKLGAFETSLDQMARTSRFAWIKELRDDPGLGDRIEWRAVENRIEEWNDEEHGLSEMGATFAVLLSTLVPGASAGSLPESLVKTATDEAEKVLVLPASDAPVEGGVGSPTEVADEGEGQAASTTQNKL
jgi:filamentous hemagglutinin family protein